MSQADTHEASNGQLAATHAHAADLNAIVFNADGLVPAIVQDNTSGEVLMLAWMNAESLALSLSEGRTVFWSRSRSEIWRKGETSGHTQTIQSLRFDCDGDALLVKVDQVGVACHTGAPSCFFGEFAS